MDSHKLPTHKGPDGRLWRFEGTRCWHCYEDGTIIQALDQILPSGATKAEMTLRRLMGQFVEKRCSAKKVAGDEDQKDG